MSKKRWTVEDKAKIVMESLTTSASTADICKKYGLSRGCPRSSTDGLSN